MHRLWYSMDISLFQRTQSLKCRDPHGFIVMVVAIYLFSCTLQCNCCLVIGDNVSPTTMPPLDLDTAVGCCASDAIYSCAGDCCTTLQRLPGKNRRGAAYPFFFFITTHSFLPAIRHCHFHHGVEFLPIPHCCFRFGVCSFHGNRCPGCWCCENRWANRQCPVTQQHRDQLQVYSYWCSSWYA